MEYLETHRGETELILKWYKYATEKGMPYSINDASLIERIEWVGKPLKITNEEEDRRKGFSKMFNFVGVPEKVGEKELSKYCYVDKDHIVGIESASGFEKDYTPIASLIKTTVGNYTSSEDAKELSERLEKLHNFFLHK